MKRTAFLLLLVMASCGTAKWPSEKYISAKNYISVIGDLNAADTITHKPPMYPGGLQGIREFIHKNTSYPEQARKENLHGRVVVKYVVGSDGYVRDLEVVQSVHPVLDAEALRVIGLMERWIPGAYEGKPVGVILRQPFGF